MVVSTMTDHDTTVIRKKCIFILRMAKAPKQAETNVFIFRFLGSEDKETFFTRAQRSRMVYEILSATTFGREKKGEVYYIMSIFLKSETKRFFQVGISRLVEEGAFNAAFPLHDVTITQSDWRYPLDKCYFPGTLPISQSQGP